jgi:hypothetical protein
MAERHCRSTLALFAVLLFIAAAPLSLAAHAHAQDTLRVGRAIADSWSFVPLDVGTIEDIKSRQPSATDGSAAGLRNV